MGRIVWPVRGLAIGLVLAGLMLGAGLRSGQRPAGFWLPLLGLCWAALAGGTIYLLVTQLIPAMRRVKPFSRKRPPASQPRFERARVVLDLAELGFFAGITVVTLPLMMIMKQA